MDPIELKRYIYYNNGELFWCERTPGMFKGDYPCASCAAWNTKFAHKACYKSITPDGCYHRVIFQKRKVLVHRAVWALTYGEWPEDVIDHIDGDPFNNTIGNLRGVNQLDNTRNRALSKNNTSGYSGVNWDKHNKAWIGRVYVKHKAVRVYYGKDKDEALEKVLEARKKFGFHINHGRGEKHPQKKEN